MVTRELPGLGRLRFGPVNALALLSATCLMSCCTAPGTRAGDPDVISAEEVAEAGVNNAHELIQRLRPLWLRSRGGRSTRLETEIVVYLNRSMIGGPEALLDIPIEIVRSVRVLDAAEAGRLPGLGSRHVERAILVETGGGVS